MLFSCRFAMFALDVLICRDVLDLPEWAGLFLQKDVCLFRMSLHMVCGNGCCVVMVCGTCL